MVGLKDVTSKERKEADGSWSKRAYLFALFSDDDGKEENTAVAVWVCPD